MDLAPEIDVARLGEEAHRKFALLSTHVCAPTP
jgi:hypothetical protein